jgi:DNA-binding NtrC family response regulator
MSQDTAIVVLTAFGSLEGAIEAIKQGAYDYLAKPFKKEEIKLVVQRSLDHCRLLRENTKFREELKSKDEWSPLVGSSPAALEVYKLRPVSESRSTVLYKGKVERERADRPCHPRQQPPPRQAVRPVNCGALPTLSRIRNVRLKKGAFTGLSARRLALRIGKRRTLFLDEIGELGQPCR